MPFAGFDAARIAPLGSEGAPGTRQPDFMMISFWEEAKGSRRSGREFHS